MLTITKKVVHRITNAAKCHLSIGILCQYGIFYNLQQQNCKYYLMVVHDMSGTATALRLILKGKQY